MKRHIQTELAPTAIGAYSQAIQVDRTVYLSGQIPLDPVTGTLITGDIAAQVAQVFANLRAVCKAAGGDLDHIVKLTVYLMDLADFAILNDMMQQLFAAPYPARATIQVAALPKGARVEVDAVMVMS